jgi:hypothetical protein
MKTSHSILAALLTLSVTATETEGRGDARGGKGSSGGRSGGGASATRNPATGSKVQRPASRPAPQPAARPQAKPAERPQARPAERPQPKPESRPAERPQTRPSVERPTTRPAPTPDKRPDSRPERVPDRKPEINRPDNKPDLSRPDKKPDLNRPDLNRPGNNDGPLANRPDKNRPSTLPGMVSYPDRPGKDKPNLPNLGDGRGDDKINIGGRNDNDRNKLNVGGRGDDKINIGGDRNSVHIDNVNVGRRNVGLNRPSTLPAKSRNWDNKQWGGKNSVWGNNVNIGNDVNINIDNNFRRSNNFSYRPNYWGARPWWGAGQCHTWHHGHWGYGYNSHYYHSHWYYHDDNDFAEGFMWGIAAWSLGNKIFDMGYQSYKNPYPAPPVQKTTIVYTQPLSVSAAKSPPGDDATATTAETRSAEALDRSRAAFKKGDYVTAMSTVDEAISYMPGDVTLHEYRALVLFALGKYAESAGVLNPVLASGPGWGWETMIAFYDSSSTYTTQLRKLEAYAKGEPDGAEGHFLLGYHYMVSDHMEQANAEFAATAKLQPADSVARQLRDLTASSLPDGGEPDTAPAVRPEPVPAERLTGTWVSDRGADGKVTFVMTADGNYTWSYMNGEQKSELKGTYGLNEKGLLVLSGEDSQMVSEVTLSGDSTMKFVLVGAPEGDPGLEFKKS